MSAEMNHRDDFHHIAVIGRFGRFPGAPDLGTYWNNLRQGVESISFFTDEELLAAGTPPETLADPNFVKAKSVIADADAFDAAFFGYSPSEAARMDPQHRVFLEAASSALEDAGYGAGNGDDPDGDARVGVFGGVAANTYLRNLYSDPSALEGVSDIQIIVGNDKDFLATKVSYKLDLRGPSVAVQTACSSSLVAIHLACQSLINHEASMALAGGVSVKVPLVSGFHYLVGGHRSPDGRCRAFDASSAGTAFGDGVGIVVLKRLADAIADGDTIHAVIRGTAINNDGALKAGYTAPSETGQSEVVAEALAVAGLEPTAIGMVEAHGTGTTLGDPIEVAALRRVFGGAAPGGPRTALGSVKTNIGHLDAAAGVAGLLKAVAALEYGEIPPSLHFETPNPRLELDDSPFFVPTKTVPWPFEGRRRAGVSSFGVGGTNAHVVLEQAPIRIPSGPSRPWQLLVLSAHTDQALETLSRRLAEHLEGHPEQPLADVAHTLRVGRRALPRRRAVVGRDAQTLAGQLAAAEGFTASAERDDRAVAFLFPGQGSQAVGMGRELYRHEDEYRRWVDAGAEGLVPHLGFDLRTLLDPEEGQQQEAEHELTKTAKAQPALFVVSHALARLWMSWGLEPQAMLGHSLGEWVAACLSGVVAFEDALPLVAARGVLMQGRPAGSMLSVPLPAVALEPQLGETLELAAINAPDRTVVTGPTAAVDELARRLEADGIGARPVVTSHAFHSRMMEPMLAAFADRLKRVTLRAPQIPFVSNLTGTWITPQQATDPDYWCQQLRRTVRFADGLATLAQRQPVMLEVGPGQTLTSLARRAGSTALSSLGRRQLDERREEGGEHRQLLATLGALWAQGVMPDWRAFVAGEERHRVALPTYPFERQRYWVERQRVGIETANATATGSPKPTRQMPEDWLSVPVWRELAPAEPGIPDDGAHWLLIADRGGLAPVLSKALARRGVRHTLAQAVVPGAESLAVDPDTEGLGEVGFEEVGAGGYRFAPGQTEALRRLLATGPYAKVVDLRAADPAATESDGRGPSTEPFHELLALGLAVAESGGAGLRNDDPFEWVVVSSGLWSVAGEGPVEPAKALLTGPLRVLPQEEPGLLCRSLDVSQGEIRLHPTPLAETLADELATLAPPRWLALRAGRRFERGLAPWSSAEVALGSSDRLRRGDEGGIYLITGGLGGLGWTLALHLAEHYRARLMLVGRSPFPERDTWDAVLEDAGTRPGSPEPSEVPGSIRRRLETIRRLETAGAMIRVRSADVTGPSAMADVLAETERELGPLAGVFHAAGVAGGGLARRRERQAIEAVFAAKVAGAAVLDRLLAERDPDLVVFFSSINAVVGGIGQVDYVAANAYLDALARRRTAEGRPTLSIAWDAWLEVGMAAGGLELDPDRHLFLQQVETQGDTLVAHTALRGGHAWVADEHHILGRSIVPGTSHLEVARALFETREGAVPLEIRDVFFMAPLLVGSRPTRVESRLEATGDGDYRYQIASLAPGVEAGAEPTVHAMARVVRLEGSPEPFDLDAARARCTEEPSRDNLRTWWLGYDGSRDDEEVARYGPRWRNLSAFRWHREGEVANESLAELTLDPAVRDDLRTFGFHPGLMDVAVGSLYRARDRGAYAPFSYGSLRIWDRIPTQTVVWARRLVSKAAETTAPESTQGPATEGPESLAYDIVVCAPDGRVLVEVEGYTYKRVRMADPVAGTARAGVTTPETPVRGLASAEGLEVLERLLARRTPPQVVVSTLDPAVLQHEIETRMARLRDPGVASRSGTAHPRPDLSTAYVAPRDPAEEQLAEIFQQVLGIDRIGVDDSFFELGGDSVIAIQIIARAGQAGLPLSPNDLFGFPTVAELAERASAGSGRRELPPIEPSEGSQIPLSLNQKRYWARYVHGGPSASLNLPLAVGLLGDLDIPVLWGSLQHITDRHEAMRTRFRRRGDKVVQVVADHLDVAMPLVDLGGLPSDRSARESRRLRDIEASHVFDLEREDLFRITLVRRATDEHQLFVVKHHMITDGWSGGLFAQELASLYATSIEGRPPELPELTIRYGDFAHWQRRHLVEGGVLATELDYWRAKLSEGSFPTLRLVGDHPRRPGGGFESRDFARQLGEKPYETLKAFARRQNVTPFMVLLAAFNVLLTSRSGQHDIALTTDVANRDRVETEPLIGMFTNVLVLRNDLAGDPTVATLLERTRTSTIEAFDHQSLPFPDLMDAVKPGLLEAYHEVFPAAFVFQNYPGRSFSLPGVELRSLEIDPGSVSRDLLAILGETGDGLRVAFRYRSDVFDASTIERLLDDYLELLVSLPENTDRRLSELLAELELTPNLATVEGSGVGG